MIYLAPLEHPINISGLNSSNSFFKISQPFSKSSVGSGSLFLLKENDTLRKINLPWHNFQ
jgi:hypothetical protein